MLWTHGRLQKSRGTTMHIVRITVPIFGLGCGGGGALTVERCLATTPGVLRAYVNPLTEMAYVEYDASVVGPRQVADAIERTGFRAGESSVR